MTVSLAQLDANTNTFGDWLFRTNEISNTISTVVVTVDSTSPPSGNAVVNGSIQATTLFVDTITGGDIGNTGPITVSSNTIFSANVSFTGNTVSYGNPSIHQYTLANATHYHLVANTASGRLRLGKGILLDETNPSGNLTVNGYVDIPTLYVSTISGGDFGNTSTLVIDTDLRVDGNVSINAASFTIGTEYTLNSTAFSANVVTFTVDSTDFVFNGNTFSLNTTSATFSSDVELTGNLVANSSTITIEANSDLIVKGIEGPENLRDSINTIKEDILNFAIALG